MTKKRQPQIGQPIRLHVMRNRIKTSVYAGQITWVNESGTVDVVYFRPDSQTFRFYTQVSEKKPGVGQGVSVWWEDASS